MDRVPHTQGCAGFDGVERFTLHSAGLDVGTATSHLTVSRLELARPTGELSSRLVVSERVELFRSDIGLTPYDGDLIDALLLAEFFDDGFAASGFSREDIDSGVVIITGEAANRTNAHTVAERLASRSGSFLCVAAGDHYEAVLAAHGSGAVAMSATGLTVLNIDIGGGTTKLCVVRDGDIQHTAALAVGSRLIAWDDDMTLTRVEPAGRWFLDQVWSGATVGQRVGDDVLDGVAQLMGDLIGEAIGSRSRGSLLRTRWLTEPLSAELLDEVHTVTFSGGVAEYVYERETRAFGDLGPRLGAEARRRLLDDLFALGRLTVEPPHGIRATVLGAAEHSLMASGVTSHVDANVLPVHGLKVIKADAADPRGLADRLVTARARFAIEGIDLPSIFAITMGADPDYPMLRRTGEELVRAATRDAPLFVAVDADVAAALGRILERELGWTDPVLVIDGISVDDLDYLDIGRPLGVVDAVPVTVKALTFLHP